MTQDELYLATERDVKGQGLFYDYDACPFHKTALGRKYCGQCTLRYSCEQHTGSEKAQVVSNVTRLKSLNGQLPFIPVSQQVINESDDELARLRLTTGVTGYENYEDDDNMYQKLQFL